jgi:prepilin-type N-terminal cleavage/methylation domain-containing protein
MKVPQLGFTAALRTDLRHASLDNPPKWAHLRPKMQRLEPGKLPCEAAHDSIQRERGLTLLEVLVSVAIISVLAVMFLPAVEKVRQRARQTACSSHLHQLGVLMHAYAHDHDNLFPAQVPAGKGGSRDSARGSPDAFDVSQHWQLLSDTASDPKLLVCPADLRNPARQWKELQTANLSYFVGLNAALRHPDSVLSGDRNIDVIPRTTSPVLRLTSGVRPTWTALQHHFRGNLLFADGRVEFVADDHLASSLRQATGEVATLWLPSTKAPASNRASRPSDVQQSASRTASPHESPAVASPTASHTERSGTAASTIKPADDSAPPAPQRSAVPGSSSGSPSLAVTTMQSPASSPASSALPSPAPLESSVAMVQQPDKKGVDAQRSAVAPAPQGKPGSEPEVQPADSSWAEGLLTTLAQSIAKPGSRLLWLWLILLLIVVALTTLLEISRRRRLRRRRVASCR